MLKLWNWYKYLCILLKPDRVKGSPVSRLHNFLRLLVMPQEMLLTRFLPMSPIYTPRKHQNTFGFLVFSAVVKWEHWPEMGEIALQRITKY